MQDVEKKWEKRLESPRVRNSDCKEYFAVSFFTLMLVMERDMPSPTDRTEVSFAIEPPPQVLDKKPTSKCKLEVYATEGESQESSRPVTSSFRNVTTILETTQNFMDTLEKSNTVVQGRGGVRVEDLINRFKSEAKFETMPTVSKKKQFDTNQPSSRQLMLSATQSISG